MKLKQCPSCKKEGRGPLPAADFYKNKARHDGLQPYCMDCWDQQSARFGRRFKRVAADLRRFYSLTIAEYEAMFARQDGRCAICRVFLYSLFDVRRNRRRNKRYVAHVDHCHATGKVRGLLCNECNNGLGKFRDRQEILLNAVGYLRASATSRSVNRPGDVKAQGKDEPQTRDLDRAQVGERRQVH